MTRTTTKRKTATNGQQVDIKDVLEILLRQQSERDESNQGNSGPKYDNTGVATHEWKMVEALTTIKWCVIGICSVMALALVLGIWALVQVERAVVEVERDVENVTSRVDNILHEIEHPFETTATLLGRDLDKSVGDLLGIPSTGEKK